MSFADSIAGNLEKIEHAAIKTTAAGADAVLFPECATTGSAGDFGALKPSALRQAPRTVAAVAARLRVNLVVGSPIFAGRRLYNAMIVFDRRGRLIHSYAKCQLVDSDGQWFTPGGSTQTSVLPFPDLP